MQLTFKRELIRTCGFSAGVLVSLILYPPWNDHTRPDILSDIVRAFAYGCIGIALAEVLRKYIPEQRQLDGAEESALAEGEMKKLMVQRRIIRFAGLVIGLAFPFLIYQLHDLVSHPHASAWIFFFWVFAMVIAAEIFLSINPKQQILTRILRKNKSG